TNSVTDLTPGGGGVILDPPGGVYLSNTLVTAIATNWPGWTFMFWAGDLAGTNPTNSFPLNGPKTFRAVFGTSLSAATLNGAADGSVSQDPPNGPYPYGSLVRLSALPAPGRLFYEWVGTGPDQVDLFNSPMEWEV